MVEFAAPVLGQGEDYAGFLAQARRLQMHHGLLITGAPGTGKTSIALHLAQALLCSGEDEDRACGVCKDCQKGPGHADLHRLEIPEDKDEIPVELVRELRESLLRRPVEGRARVVVIDPADRLNVQGQNALLKTLEEPGHNTFLLLPTSRPEGLLDTVRSRVAALRCRPLGEDELATELGRRHPSLGEPQARWALELAAGSLGRCEQLIEGDLQALHTLLEAWLEHPEQSPNEVAKAALEGASGRIETLNRARETLWMLRTLVRKELRRTLASADTAPYLAATSDRWTTAVESLFAAESDLHQRIPPEQVLVNALLQLS